MWLFFFSLIILWIAFVSYKEARKRVNVGAPAPIKGAFFVTLMSFFFLIFLKIGEAFLSYKLLDDEISFVSIFVVIAVIIWAASSFSCVGYFFLGFFSFLLDRSIRKYYLLIVPPVTYIIFLVSLIIFNKPA